MLNQIVPPIRRAHLSPQSIAVVIPNYNGGTKLLRCIQDAFSALRYWSQQCHSSGGKHKIFEVILVDDASTEDNISHLQGTFPELRVLKNPHNLGFAPTCNRGAREATADWIMFLNNDCYLEQNYFQNIFSTEHWRQAEVFSLQGSISGFDGKLRDGAKFPAAIWRGSWPILSFGIRSTTNITAHGSSQNTPLPTLFSSGCNAIVNRAKFEELGGFDELFAPYYLEDVDLGIPFDRKFMSICTGRAPPLDFFSCG